MHMNGKKNIRIVLTAAVLLLGGYYIQQTSQSGSSTPSYFDRALADVPQCCAK